MLARWIVVDKCGVRPDVRLLRRAWISSRIFRRQSGKSAWSQSPNVFFTDCGAITDDRVIPSTRMAQTEVVATVPEGVGIANHLAAFVLEHNEVFTTIHPCGIGPSKPSGPAVREWLFSAKPIRRSAINKTGIFGPREHVDICTRFAQGSKVLRLLHLY